MIISTNLRKLWDVRLSAPLSPLFACAFLAHDERKRERRFLWILFHFGGGEVRQEVSLSNFYSQKYFYSFT
jgi:hypothetical protein